MKKLLCLMTAGILILSACGKTIDKSSSNPESPVIDNVVDMPPSDDDCEIPSDYPIGGIDSDNFPIIDGSTANHPLIARIYSEICAISLEDAETLVALDLGSTGSIWEKMINGNTNADILIVYEPPEEIKAQYANELQNFEIDPLGRDGLVFLANTENPVDSLTCQELFDIYTGKLTDWSEVGGTNGPIKPFQRNADSGSQTLFMKLLMKGESPMEPPTELLQMTMGGLIDGVAAFDGSGSALGYSVYYYANLMYSNPDLKLLAVDGVEPTNETIRDGSYPLTNDFYVVIRADEPKDSDARKVRDWLLSEEGERILKEENYVWARDGLSSESVGAGNPFIEG